MVILRKVSMRHIFAFSAVCFLSVAGFATSPSATPEKLEEVRAALRSNWTRVDYKQPAGFETIFQNLDETLWPALPVGYEWRIEQDQHVNLYKHESAKSYTLEFVVYRDEFSSRVNFLSRWKGKTRHAFAYTRRDGNSGLRDTYPVSQDQFKLGNATYVRGHCVDFLDTMGVCSTDSGGTTVQIKSISTLDPRNFIPEPCKAGTSYSYWGQAVRSQAVQEIRQKGGCYAQYMDYGITKPQCTAGQVRIPTGVWFVETSTPDLASPDKKVVPLAAYYIDWTNAQQKTGEEWDAFLLGRKRWPVEKARYSAEEAKAAVKLLKPLNPFFPSPAVNDSIDGVSCAYQDGDFDYHVHAFWANYESESLAAKHVLIERLCRTTPLPYEKIARWTHRVIHHARVLHERGKLKPECSLKVRGLHSTLCQEPVKSKVSESREGCQLVEGLSALVKWIERDTSAGLASSAGISMMLPVLKPSKNVYPLACVNLAGVSNLSGAGPIADTIVELLNQIPPVAIKLVNISTQRAGYIAAALKARLDSAPLPFSSPGKVRTENLKRLCLYATDPAAKHITNVTPAFGGLTTISKSEPADWRLLPLTQVIIPFSCPIRPPQTIARAIVDYLQDNPERHLLLLNLSKERDDALTQELASQKAIGTLGPDEEARIFRYKLSSVPHDLRIAEPHLLKVPSSVSPSASIAGPVGASPRSPARSAASPAGRGSVTPPTPPIPLRKIPSDRASLLAGLTPSLDEVEALFAKLSPELQREFLRRQT